MVGMFGFVPKDRNASRRASVRTSENMNTYINEGGAAKASPPKPFSTRLE